MTFLKRRHKRTPLCTKKRRRERLSRSAQIRVPLPPHHFCELDGRARIASSKGERFEPRENAEHTRRLEETREVSRPKNHHIRLLGISKRRRHQCAIESTYNNRNRKRLKKWRRNESRKSLWCVVLLLFSRGENVVRFFSGVGVVADGSRRVARARSRISRRL